MRPAARIAAAAVVLAAAAPAAPAAAGPATVAGASARAGSSTAASATIVDARRQAELVELLRQARDALPGDPGAAGRDLAAAATLLDDPGVLAPIGRVLASGDTARARRQLVNEVAALEAPPSAAATDPAAERGVLDGVYARPPLDRLDSGVREEATDPILSALGRLTRWVDDRLGRTGSLAVGATLLAVLAALLVRQARRTLSRRARVAAAEPPQPGQDPESEWAAGLEAAARGDHREAVRRAFRSALLSVAVRGRLAVDASWTNRELLARVRADADLVAALAPAAAGFEEAWYSGRPVTPAHWELARTRCEALRQLARRPAAEAARVEAPR